MFPKITSNNLKGITGQAYFEYFVNEYLKCIYHPISEENDFGIDGYIELVINNNVTAKLVGVQIKHGNSFFNNPTTYGYKFIGNEKHLNYYLNSQVPIFIVIMDEEFNKMNWVQFDISKTMPVGQNKWYIEIPKNNELQTNFKDALFQAAGPVVEFKELIQFNWNINSLIKNSGNKVLAIPKSQILNKKFDCINNLINRLSINKEILVNSRTTIDIFFPEYNMDPREIFQIPEIMEWLKTSINIGIPWFYFLDYKYKNNGLNLLVHSYCHVEETYKKENKFLFNYNKLDMKNFLERNFTSMNIFMDKNDIDLEINKEISDGIITYYIGK